MGNTFCLDIISSFLRPISSCLRPISSCLGYQHNNYMQLELLKTSRNSSTSSFSSDTTANDLETKKQILPQPPRPISFPPRLPRQLGYITVYPKDRKAIEVAKDGQSDWLVYLPATQSLDFSPDHQYYCGPDSCKWFIPEGLYLKSHWSSTGDEEEIHLKARHALDNIVKDLQAKETEFLKNGRSLEAGCKHTLERAKAVLLSGTPVVVWSRQAGIIQETFRGVLYFRQISDISIRSEDGHLSTINLANSILSGTSGIMAADEFDSLSKSA